MASLYLALPTLVLGLPTYLVLQAKRRTAWHAYVCCGALIGSTIALLLVLPYMVSAVLVSMEMQRNSVIDRGHLVYETFRDGMLITGRFFLGGIIAGFVFWAIVRPDRASGAAR